MTDSNSRSYAFPDGDRARIEREREDLERAIEERATFLAREETLRWAHVRAAERDAVASPDVAKRFPSAREVMREHESQPASLTREWATYIRQQLDKRDRVLQRAVAVVLIEEEKARKVLSERVKALEAELAELRAELREHGQRGLRAVSS